MDYEATYSYCAKLQYQAVTDAYFYLDMGNQQMYKGLMGLAKEAIGMMKSCLQATDSEMVN